FNVESLSRQGGHPAHRLFNAEKIFLPCVNAKHSWKCTCPSRVRQNSRVVFPDAAVGSKHYSRILHDGLYVVFTHIEENHLRATMAEEVHDGFGLTLCVRSSTICGPLFVCRDEFGTEHFGMRRKGLSRTFLCDVGN